MTEPVKDTTAEIHSPSELLELKSRLLDELKTLETATTTANLEENATNIIDIQTSVAELKEKLLDESNNVSLRELIIKRLEMQLLLSEVLFKQNKDERDIAITKNSLDDSKIITEIMRTQKDVEALDVKCDNLMEENLKLKHENSVLMENLKAQQSKAQAVPESVLRDKEYRLLKSELDMRTKSLKIYKNIIPRLFVGAGISDSSIQDLVLQCGEPTNI